MLHKVIMASSFSTGRIAIAVCGRCSVKVPYRDLMSDGNYRELKVCSECRDEIDPYRLAPRQPDSYILRNPRPDRSLTDIPNYLLDDYGLPVYDNITGEPIEV